MPRRIGGAFSMAKLTTTEHEDTLRGLYFALAAYGLWGMLPLFLKMLSHMPMTEVVAHRVIWSVPLAALVLLGTGRVTDLMRALRSPKSLALAALTAALVATNWGIYVWAIASGRALDASLGYYINPIFSVFLGALLLGEKPDRYKLVSIVIAGAAVLVLVVEAGSLPLASIGLTLSWGFYAFFKRRLQIGPNQAFMLEVLILLPVALGYALWLQSTGQSHFGATKQDTWLLLFCGLVTTTPLVLYGNGAKGLRLSTIAMLGYIVPTMIFLFAVFIFDEPVSSAKLVAFPLIWLSLAVFSYSLIKARKTARVT